MRPIYQAACDLPLTLQLAYLRHYTASSPLAFLLASSNVTAAKQAGIRSTFAEAGCMLGGQETEWTLLPLFRRWHCCNGTEISSSRGTHACCHPTAASGTKQLRAAQLQLVWCDTACNARAACSARAQRVEVAAGEGRNHDARWQDEEEANGCRKQRRITAFFLLQGETEDTWGCKGPLPPRAGPCGQP